MINLLQIHLVFRDRQRGMFALWRRGDGDLRLRARRRITVCIGLSLLVHALLFVATIQDRIENDAASIPSVQGPLAVRLIPLAASPSIKAVAPKRAPSIKPRPRQMIVLSKPAPHNPVIVEQPPVPPAPTPEAEPAPPMDMMAMINSARELRRTAEDAASRENAEAAANNRQPSANDIAMENIKRDLQSRLNKRDGTSGVFEIISKGTRTAQFVFRGWLASSRNNWRETIDVDAGLNGDVDLAIVRRMIELIRAHYSGDFNWESHRLGHVIVLSARQRDSAELESFLMREFFGKFNGQ